MLRISQAVLCVSLVFGIIGCRASFQNIQKKGLFSSGDDLGAKGDDGTKKPDPEYPTLKNVKELSAEDSASYGCDGIVVITESGKDKNLDGILQPTEVTDIKTECRPNTKDPETPQCPAQNAGKGGDCPDDPTQGNPGQNDPGQNDPTQSLK